MQLPYRKPGKYQNQTTDPLITSEKFDALTKDLARLKQKRPKAAEEVSRLAELGDFSENVEYQQAKGRLRGINERILRTEYQLNHSTLITLKQTGKVEIGNTVLVEINGKEKKMTILGSSETDPAKGIISHSSPIGSALLGKKVGDSVEILVNGSTRTYKISDVK